MFYLTRREHFNAAHKLFNPNWSDEKNTEVFGGCANPNWHGHNYTLFVTVKGKVNDELGYVVNMKDISSLIKKHVIDLVDHKNLNLDVAFLTGIIPSAENFAKAIWFQLSPHIIGCELHCIKLYETENIYVEYLGE
ncbi:MAG: 6-carboxy-5,6,7,8-tetrahydropterin synthase [Bacteroidota bacterium]|jgi:6-pyruvoyltetrahydropterin/6-carboxytetrahydropterin synthase